MDVDYIVNLSLLANTPAPTENLQHSLIQEAGDIGYYMKLDKTEFMYLKKDCAISTLNDKSLKLETISHTLVEISHLLSIY